jgi:hypothetical protein
VNKDKEFMDMGVVPLIGRVAHKEVIPKMVPSGYGNGKYKVHVSSVELCNLLSKNSMFRRVQSQIP